MRRPSEWRREDLDELIGLQVPESLELEYKSSAALGKTSKQRDDLCKDVSAFANSAGGALVYGIAEKDRLPSAFDTGVDPNEISPEWIQQVIFASVHPRIEGLSVHGVSINGAAVAYVVHVPQSRTAHMTMGRYYKRYDGQSIPMEDYEVRDTMRRSEVPDVVLELRAHPSTDQIALEVIAVNRSDAPAEFFAAILYLGPELTFSGSSGGWERRGTRRVLIGEEVELTCFQFNWHGCMPLFSGMKERMSHSFTFAARYGRPIFWETRAPGMLNNAGFLIVTGSWGLLRPFAEWSFVEGSESF